MSARPGNWQFLDHSRDPVGGDPARIAELTAYYATMAETISSEAAILGKIGDGDTTQLKGASADALRSRSRDVSGSLAQASGRYEAVGNALKGYAPQLDLALSESARALADAEAAEQSRVASNALADPSANRPSGAPPLTDVETSEISQRTSAIGQASDAAAAAKVRLENALSVFRDAGKAASTVIRAAWDDGLTDTLSYKIKEFFKNFLKILVKVLMWIGVALAVLAFFIPGLAALALAGLVVAVISLAASTALAAMGEGSWLDVILGAVSILLLGSGALIAKIVQTSHVALLGKIGTSGAKQLATVSKFSAKVDIKRTAIFNSALKGKIPVQTAIDRINKLDRHLITSNLKNVTNAKNLIAKDFKVKPQFWNIKHPDYFPNDLGKIKDVLGGTYKWDRLLSVDRALKYKQLQDIANSTLGVSSKAQPIWHFANGGRVIAGWMLNINKIASYPPSPYNDSVSATKAALTTAKI